MKCLANVRKVVVSGQSAFKLKPLCLRHATTTQRPESMPRHPGEGGDQVPIKVTLYLNPKLYVSPSPAISARTLSPSPRPHPRTGTRNSMSPKASLVPAVLQVRHRGMIRAVSTPETRLFPIVGTLSDPAPKVTRFMAGTSLTSLTLSNNLTNPTALSPTVPYQPVHPGPAVP